jgi:hydrogenase nickel incorporation protein HypA/HybF
VHEYSIVASLIDRVQQEAAAHGGSRVHRLHVKIGELSGVEIDLLKTAFDTFRERTICDGAELAIDTVAPAWACPSCERAVAMRRLRAPCPHDSGRRDHLAKD